MDQGDIEWHRVIPAGKKGFRFLNEGEIREMELGGRQICIARDGEKLFAVSARCPHNGAALCRGVVEPGAIITCPLHRFRFSMESGKNVSGEGFYLQHFPLEIREEGTFVGLPRKKFLGLW